MRQHGSRSIAEDSIDSPEIETGVTQSSLDRFGLLPARRFERIFHKRFDLRAPDLKSCESCFGFRPGNSVNRTRIETEIAEAQLHSANIFFRKISRHAGLRERRLY